MDARQPPLTIINRFLAIVALMMNALSVAPKVAFPQKVFFRLFLSLIYDLTAPDKFIDPFSSTILGAFVDALHAVRPSRVPQFAFAWLELVSHRAFMPKVCGFGTRREGPEHAATR